MADAFDVAAYILRELGNIPTRKLQKLVYYAQAWSVTLRGRPIYDEAVEAWREGPVIRCVYEKHQGEKFIASLGCGNPDALSQGDRNVAEAILATYGEEGADALVERTHAESPWKDAWGDLPPDGTGHEVIGHQAMKRYYSDCPERESIKLAIIELSGKRFFGDALLRMQTGNAPSAEKIALAQKALIDRAALPTEEPDAWVRRMTENLAGADD